MTDKEWKEIGVYPTLGKQWKSLMDELNYACINVYGPKKVKNVDNEIRVGPWTITVNFINNKWLEMYVTKKDEELMRLKYKKDNERVMALMMIYILETY